MGGHDPPHEWAPGGLKDLTYKLGGDDDIVFVEVSNALTLTKIINVFGVIKGFIDPGTQWFSTPETNTFTGRYQMIATLGVLVRLSYVTSCLQEARTSFFHKIFPYVEFYLLV